LFMSATTQTHAFPADMPRLLAAAPHRPLFLAGTVAVMLTMLWWTLELASIRFGLSAWPQPVGIPMGWAHAMAIQYGLFPLFMFGSRPQFWFGLLITAGRGGGGGAGVRRGRSGAGGGGVLGAWRLARVGCLGWLWMGTPGYVLCRSYSLISRKSCRLWALANS